MEIHISIPLFYITAGVTGFGTTAHDRFYGKWPLFVSKWLHACQGSIGNASNKEGKNIRNAAVDRRP